MKSGTRFFRRCGMFLVAAAAVLSPVIGSSGARVDAVALVSSTPADGASLATSPPQVIVTFDQSIGSAFTMVITCNGSPATYTAARVSDDLHSLIVDASTTPLPKGQCNVLWVVKGLTASGTNTGTFSFKIQQDTVLTQAPVETVTSDASAATAATVAGSSSSSASQPSDFSAPLGLFRLISTIALAALFGALVLITVAWPEGVEYILTIRFLRYSWIIGVISTWLMVACMVAGSSNKSFTGALIPTSWSTLTDSTPGIAALARLVLIAAAGWVAMRPERVIDPSTQLAALAIPGLAIATLGFSRSGGDLELVGYAAGVGHALAMAVWVGGLILLTRVVLAGPGEDDLVHAVRGFGRMATPAMVLTIVTGAVQVYRLDRGHLLDTTHGRLMLLKLVPVLAMVFVGVATRQFVTARLTRAEELSAPLAGKLRRAVGMEAVIGVLVLAVTAWMLSTQPGNISASARSSNDFALQQSFADVGGKLDARVSVNPGRVGANEVLIEVIKPSSGISSLTVQFDPPANSFANPVLMTIPEFPAGVGGWYLPLDVGIPLNGPGAWNVTLNMVATDGTFSQSKLITVLPAVGTLTSDTIPLITQPPVTAPPTTVAPATTTTIAGA